MHKQLKTSIQIIYVYDTHYKPESSFLILLVYSIKMS